MADMKLQKVANDCLKKLDFSQPILSETYFYNSVPLAVIDAVYSLGIRYATTKKVVASFCERAGIVRLREYGSAPIDTKDQFAISDFIQLVKLIGLDTITSDFFRSKNRTSTTNGILKSEAVLNFCKILQLHGIEYLQDLQKLFSNGEMQANLIALERALRSVKGQKSGISTSYFFMLCGDGYSIKPDRMVLRFLKESTSQNVFVHEAKGVLSQVLEILKKTYPVLTLRELDHAIWKYESAR